MKNLSKMLLFVLPIFVLSVAGFAADGEIQPDGQAINATSTAASLTPIVAAICAVASLIMAVVFYKKMMSAPAGTPKMIEIASHVREGAYAYLRRQYKSVAVVFVVLVAIFAALAYFGIQNPFVLVAFLSGGIFSGLCGYLGMKTATNAS